MKTTDYLIIGAGHCGLATGRYLQKAGKDFIILDQHQDVGDSWRKRYESLRLFTPAKYNHLPDLPMALPPNERPTKDQLADYFSRYASHFALPVHTKNTVSSIKKNGDTFHIQSTFEEIRAKKVIVANGYCQSPMIPSWANHLEIPYIHSSKYRTPVSIKGKKVLVVGGGNTAIQLIAELTKYFDVHWSIKGNPRFRKLYVLGKNVLWWGEKLNKLKKAPKEKHLRKTDPIYLYDDLKSKLKQATTQKEVVGAQGNQVTFADQKTEQYDFVLFATGFQQDYSFIQIDDFENDMAALRDQQGISRISGLYFVGIPYQRTRSSHLIYGSRRDAEFIVSRSLDPA